MKTKFLMAAIAAGMLATMAQAEGSHGLGRDGGPRIDFGELDANADGQLTLAEVQNAAAARFAGTDANGDGALSADEMDARAIAEVTANAATRAADMIARLDENGDGLLQAAEMQAREGGHRGERMFSHMDADEDGVVTKAEFDAAVAKMNEGRDRWRHRN